jgi:WD40 repeat protein
VHTASPTSRFRESNKLISIHDDLHRAPISAAKASLNGNWLITGSVDSTLRVWVYDGASLSLRATLCGHDGSHIKCIDVSTECGVIVSGCGSGRVVLWDLRTLIFVRLLRHPSSVAGKPVISVSINHKNGNILTLVGTLLSLFDINGNCVAQKDVLSTSLAVSSEISRATSSGVPTCAVATDCPEWMVDGIVAVTGHANGDVRLYGLEEEEDGPLERLVVRQVLDTTPHKSAISALRVTGVDRPDTLLIGDRSGRVSVCKASSLDQYSADELMHIVADLSRKAVPVLHHET